MHVRIHTKPLAGSLRVLSEFPSHRLARLEGQNGIGKTLAVRLLQLCTGRRPYPVDSRAWRSLSEGLGPFRVEVGGLRGGHSLHWAGDSRHWTTEDDDGSQPIQFDSITIDGQPANIEAVTKLLSVERLAGDERLVDTLATDADSIAATLRRWLAWHADQSHGSLAALQSLAFDCQDLLRESTQARLDDVRRQLQDAELKLQELSLAFARVQTRRDRITEAAHLANQLAALTQAAPEIKQRFAAISTEVAAVEGEREQLLGERDRLVAQADRAGEWQRELRNAERTESNNLSKVRGCRQRISALSVRLGIGPTWAELVAKEAALRRERSTLEHQRRELDKAREVRPVLEGVASALSAAESQDLGAQLAFIDQETGLELTVAQTRSGVANQATLLRDKPPAPEWSAVNKQLDDCTSLLSIISTLRDLYSDSETFAERARRNRERADNALRQLGHGTDVRRSEIEGRLKELEERRLQLAEEQAALAERLSSDSPDSPEAVESKLRSALEDGEIAAGADFDAVVAELTTNAARLASEMRDTEDRRETARAELQQITARTAAAYLELVQGRLTWASSFERTAPLQRREPEIERQLVALESVRWVVDSVYERLSGLRGQLDGVASALTSVARNLRGEPPLGPEYVPEVERWLNARFGEWFNTPGIRNHLLPRAQGEITIDIASQDVRWTEDGVRRNQPIESLSSGQQAYAYTQARLHDLDTTGSRYVPNRLIVLDEFGAFVAHDLLYQLEVWLKSWIDEHPGDQLLIILPLSQDYGERAKHTLGSDSEIYRALAAQVADRRYAVRELSP